MFEYYKGYEIDGSDTSYSLFTPNFEKLKELLKYFFYLKVIDKNKAIRITSVKKNRAIKGDFKVGKLYFRENLDKLFEDIIKNEVEQFSVEYSYVKVESLFPEVKRELIDYLILANKDNVKLEYQNPILSAVSHHDDWWMCESPTDVIDVTFKPNAEHCFDDITPDDYVKLCLEDEYFSVDFNLSVVHGGVSPLLPYYALEKIAERFPEYKLNAYKNFQEINCCVSINIDREINECFEIKPEDFSNIFKSDKFRFIDWIDYRNEKYIENKMVHIPHLMKKQKNFFASLPDTYVEGNGIFTASYNLGKNIYSKEYTLFSLLKRYLNGDTNYLSIDDYIAFCMDITQKMKLNSNEIKKYTTTYLHINEENGSQIIYLCKIRFNKEKDGGVFELIVPYRSRKLVSEMAILQNN